MWASLSKFLYPISDLNKQSKAGFNFPINIFTENLLASELSYRGQQYMSHLIVPIFLKCYQTCIYIFLSKIWYKSAHQKIYVPLSRNICTANLLGREAYEISWVGGDEKNQSWLVEKTLVWSQISFLVLYILLFKVS